MLNWWSVTLLLAAGQGLLLSASLLLSGRKDKSNIYLGLILMILSLELLNAWGMQVKYHSLPNSVPFWLLESYLVLPPSILLFVQTNTNAAFRSRPKHWLLYLPAIIEIVVETGSVVYYRRTGHTIELMRFLPWYIFTEVVPVLWTMLVLIIGGIKVGSFYRHPSPTFLPARVHAIRLYGFYALFVLIACCWAGEVFLQLPLFTLFEIIIILALFLLGYIGYSTANFSTVQHVAPKPAAAVSTYPNYDDERELERLSQVFGEQGLHTESGLTLETVAGTLDLPVRYVSYLINTYHATNFHQFINMYRVKEVIRKMEDPAQKHKTLLALALESGFNSKSSFNHIFKAHTGKTPSQYLGR